MANDSDWVADVRRWYFSSQQGKPASPVVTEDAERLDIGYEAAHPVLQSRHWPDAPRGTFADPA